MRSIIFGGILIFLLITFPSNSSQKSALNETTDNGVESPEKLDESDPKAQRIGKFVLDTVNRQLQILGGSIEMAMIFAITRYDREGDGDIYTLEATLATHPVKSRSQKKQMRYATSCYFEVDEQDNGSLEMAHDNCTARMATHLGLKAHIGLDEEEKQLDTKDPAVKSAVNFAVEERNRLDLDGLVTGIKTSKKLARIIAASLKSTPDGPMYRIDYLEKIKTQQKDAPINYPTLPIQYKGCYLEVLDLGLQPRPKAGTGKGKREKIMEQLYRIAYTDCQTEDVTRDWLIRSLSIDAGDKTIELDTNDEHTIKIAQIGLESIRNHSEANKDFGIWNIVSAQMAVAEGSLAYEIKVIVRDDGYAMDPNSYQTVDLPENLMDCQFLVLEDKKRVFLDSQYETIEAYCTDPEKLAKDSEGQEESQYITSKILTRLPFDEIADSILTEDYDVLATSPKDPVLAHYRKVKQGTLYRITRELTIQPEAVQDATQAATYPYECTAAVLVKHKNPEPYLVGFKCTLIQPEPESF